MTGAGRDGSRWTIPGALTLVVVLVLSAASVAAGARPARADGWDPRLAPIAKEVEQLRHLRFEHPIPARFLSDRAFRKLVSGDDSRPGRRRAAVVEAELRGLGLVGPGFDLRRTVSDVNGSDILAFYDSDEKKIVVRGTHLDPEHRITLAHELTHGLQDQNYDLTRLQHGAWTSGADDALTALVEGDAMRVEDLYYRRMSSADQKAVDAAESGATKGAGAAAGGPQNPDESVDAGNSFVTAQLDAPYATGPSMVAAILARRHRAGLTAAFHRPPTTQLQTLAPALATTTVHPRPLRSPRPAPGYRKLSAGPPDWGAMDLYFLLASRLPDATAIRAADAWGNGRELVSRSREDGTVCTQVAFVGRDEAGSRRIADALAQWRAAMPAGAVRLTGHGRELRVCDPGDATASAPPNPAERALDFAGERSFLQASMLQGGVPAGAAVCLTDHAVDRSDYAQFVGTALSSEQPSSAALDAFRTTLQELAAGCR